ncbi:uncharacterized protein LOC143568909 [Bidens hawaiensis]|uniref:uncharacterized protein LOC143568909 n=1 Tax=Bidens hawaiensis TaxID=980011 RepID=UPI004049C6B9
MESDGEVISVTQTLAKEAYVCFQLAKYADCLRVLNRILEHKPDDPKVLHNIAVAENFQDGFSSPKRFLEALDNLKKRSGRLAPSTGENTEVLNNGIKSVENKGIAADDFDVSVAMFNTAVILYHLHQYEKCFSILERLYQTIARIDERVAHHVCLLLLDVSLVCHRASTAADVISYLEKVGGNNVISQGDSANNPQQPTNLVMKSTSAPNNVMSSSDPINSDQIVTTNGSGSPLSRTLSDEYDNFITKINVSGVQELTRPSNDLSKTQTDESFISTPDLKLKVHLYKVWILILTRNLKAAKREVKMAMNMARGKDYSLALFLKSQLEYARNNHRKAIKLLMASISQPETETGTGTPAMYYNNLGCIYYQLGKYQTSAVFFSKALGSSPQRNEKPMKLLTFSQDKSVLFAYNCGLLYLASGKPVLAIRCFQQSGSVFFKRSLLWLRIAECCIMFSERKADIDVKIIGNGKWRQLVIECWNSRSPVQLDPVLSLGFAKSCLLNALHLLERNPNPKVGSGLDQVNSNGEAKSGNPNPLLQSSVNEYEGLCGKENGMILQAVLADLAFVYLELGNAVKALATARCLLRLPGCSRVYVFLGDIYAAEAYCLLNQPKQASEILSGYILGQNGNNNNTELPYSQEDCDIWQTRKTVDLDEPNSKNAPTLDQPLPQGGGFESWFLKPEEARGVLLANMAAMAAAEGDMERAHEAVTVALTLIPNNPEVVLTATYIDLVRGDTQGAVLKLKQCSRVRFLPGTW